MLHTCYGHGLTKGTIIQIFYNGLHNPTQGILDAKGIFLYNTPNEAFKILKDKELKSSGGIGNRVLKKKEIKKNEMVLPREPNKEWKLNENMVPNNNNFYHYLWNPTEIPHLNRIIKES
nr:reverse transcriptase domain-containing protein [Tanacetum cinerariifolium]